MTSPGASLQASDTARSRSHSTAFEAWRAEEEGGPEDKAGSMPWRLHIPHTGTHEVTEPTGSVQD